MEDKNQTYSKSIALLLMLFLIVTVIVFGYFIDNYKHNSFIEDSYQKIIFGDFEIDKKQIDDISNEINQSFVICQIETEKCVAFTKIE